MGPYSHFILAAKLAPYFQPQHAEDYYWGSIIPDIRYLAQMRRNQTHLGQERFEQLRARYPHLGSFLLGYQVHCLIDQIDVAQEVGGAFPLNVFKRVRGRNFSQQQTTMLVEMYFLRTAAASGELSGSYNEVLRDLGITAEQNSVFFEAMRGYFHSNSFDAAVSAFQKIGLIENSRLEKYMNAYQAMKRNMLMTSIFLFSVKNAGLEAHALKHVRAGMGIAVPANAP